MLSTAAAAAGGPSTFITSLRALPVAGLVSKMLAVTGDHPFAYVKSALMHPFIQIFSMVFQPFRYLLSPLVWMYTAISFIKNYQDLRKFIVYGKRFLFNKDAEAKCEFCHEIIHSFIEIDSDQPNEVIQCGAICPFRLTACMDICGQVVNILDSATDYPCIVLQMCSLSPIDELIPSSQPVEDAQKLLGHNRGIGDSKGDYDTTAGAPIETTCELKRSFLKQPVCTPHTECIRVGIGKSMSCKLKKSLMLDTKQYMNQVHNKALQLSSAFIERKYCGDLTPEQIRAGVLCIDKPTGWAWYANAIQFFMVFVVAVCYSIYSIETKTGVGTHLIIFPDIPSQTHTLYTYLSQTTSFMSFTRPKFTFSSHFLSQIIHLHRRPSLADILDCFSLCYLIGEYDECYA